MHPVVGNIACHHEGDRGYVEDCGVVGIGVPHFHRLESVSLQQEPPCRDGLEHDRAIGNQPGEVDVPALRAAYRGLPVHHRDGLLRRVRDRAGEPPDDSVGTEPVVAVPVGGVDVGQPPAGPFDPVAHPVDLVVGEWRVDQERVVFAEHQGGGHRRGHDGAAVRQPHVALAAHSVVDKYLVAQVGHGDYSCPAKCSTNQSRAATLVCSNWLR